MPRRPVKHPRKSGFQPGVSGNPSGKPRGAVNRVTISDKVREAFAQLLDNNVDQLEGWLHALAKKNPEKALDIWVRISERFVPMLSRTEITGAEGQAFSPITINLPNIPKVSIGEAAPTSLLTSPAEEVKSLSGGSLTEIPMFLQELSDSLPRGEGAPAENWADTMDTGKVQSPNLRHCDIPVSKVFGEESRDIPVEAPSQELPDSEANLEELP